MNGNPSAQLNVAWERLPWKKLEVAVYRMQKRIFQASQRGDMKTVRKIQKLLMKSKAARLLAVRRVTQDNQGKKTAGVDGVKSVPPAERLTLVKPFTPSAQTSGSPNLSGACGYPSQEKRKSVRLAFRWFVHTALLTGSFRDCLAVWIG